MSLPSVNSCFGVHGRGVAGVLWRSGIGSALREGAALGFSLAPFTAHFSPEVIPVVSETGLGYC